MRYLNLYADLTAPPRPWSSAESAEPLRAPACQKNPFPAYVLATSTPAARGVVSPRASSVASSDIPNHV